MSEGDVVERTDEPVTTERIVADLRELVHSSLASLGWVPGGAPAVVDALMESLTAEGTLVMPTHSPQLSEPSDWQAPPVPESWYEPIRESMAPYRPDVTPTRGMGSIPECFRDYPDVERSRHPAHSFAAWGSHREEIVSGHSYDYSLGEESPLARVYDLDGDVLLLGVGHDRNTSLHLGEYRADWGGDVIEAGAPVLVDGERQWLEYEDLDFDSDDFEALGADFEAEHEIALGQVGLAETRLVSQRALVDFAESWFEQNR